MALDVDAVARTSATGSGGDPLDLLDLAAALAELRTFNPMLSEAAELRHLAGLTFSEIGTAFGRGEAWARACIGRADDWLGGRLRR